MKFHIFSYKHSGYIDMLYGCHYGTKCIKTFGKHVTLTKLNILLTTKTLLRILIFYHSKWVFEGFFLHVCFGHHCTEFVWIAGRFVLFLPCITTGILKVGYFLISINVNIGKSFSFSMWKLLCHSDQVYIFTFKKNKLNGGLGVKYSQMAVDSLWFTQAFCLCSMGGSVEENGEEPWLPDFCSLALALYYTISPELVRWFMRWFC